MYSKKQSYRTNSEIDRQARQLGLSIGRVPLKGSSNPSRDSIRRPKRMLGIKYIGGEQ